MDISGITMVVPDKGTGVTSHALSTKLVEGQPDAVTVATTSSGTTAWVGDSEGNTQETPEDVADPGGVMAVDDPQAADPLSTPDSSPFTPQKTTALDSSAATSSACSALSYAWSGNRNGGMEYYRNLAKVPSYLGKTAANTDIIEGKWNIDHGYNDCGLTMSLGPKLTSMGSTTRTGNFTSTGGCGSRDAYDVIDFGVVGSYGTLARTCTWWWSVPGDNPIRNADMRFTTNQVFFTGPVPGGCSLLQSLEGVATHEFGHVFGLYHVSESEYPTLTMSPVAAVCSLADRSLGRGDYKGLYDHYGS